MGRKIIHVIVSVCVMLIIAITAFIAGGNAAKSKLMQEWEEGNTHLEMNVAEEHVDFAEYNPIDEYFDAWSKELSGTTIEMNVFAGRYAAAWKAELLYAYELLSELANPHSEQLHNCVEQSQKRYLDFADSHSELEGLVHWSDGFCDMGVDVGNAEEVHTGSGYPSAMTFAKAELYKKQTLRLHEMLRAIGGQPGFVFDANSFDEERAFQ